MNVRTILAMAGGVLASSVLFGCASTYDENWLSTQWTKAMQTYNIRPVYPPTEDLHVGDVYAIAIGQTDSSGNPIEGALWGSEKLDFIPLDKELNDYYSRVQTFPATDDTPASSTAIWHQPTTAACTDAPPAARPAPASAHQPKKQVAANHAAAAGVHAAQTAEQPAHHAAAPSARCSSANVFARTGTWMRLPIATFPAFTVAHGNAEQFSGSLPLRFFNAVFSGSHRSEDQISVTIRQAETYGVPAYPAKIRLFAYCKSNSQKYGFCLKQALESEIANLSGKGPPPDVAIALVNRIYLTRSIEFTYKASSSTAAQGSVYVLLQKVLANQAALKTALGGTNAPAQDTPVKAKAGQAADAGGTPAAAGGAPPASPSADALAAIKSDLDALLASTQSQTQQLSSSPVPGSSFSIATISDNEISLVQTFEHPVVVGYRYVSLPGQGQSTKQ
ncbi:hypothetical protein [Burkholderia sp. GS2Y]|uniref:Lipoprotein n=1 Tax=Burkholderia theae TaxID=3143496 RepID=A0ABU9WLF8_9BURK